MNFVNKEFGLFRLKYSGIYSPVFKVYKIIL